MKTVQVRQTATVRVGNTYARVMGGNKIRHYNVGLVNQLLKQMGQVDVNKLLVDAISLEEGEPVEVEILPTVYNGQQLMGAGFDPNGPITIKDVSGIVLKDHPEIEKALLKVKSVSQLHQYDEFADPLKAKYLTPITRYLNRIISKINFKLTQLQIPANVTDRFEYLALKGKIKHLPYLPEWDWKRHLVAAKFLSVGFEEDELEAAVNSLLADLKTLNDQGLIIGHLAMPSLILLADTIGSGKNMYALFAYIFTDDKKIMEILGKGPLDLPGKFLNLVGVKNETFESDIHYLNGVDPHSKYEIEQVELGTLISLDEAHQAQVDSYEAAKPFIAEFDRKNAELMSKVRVSSDSQMTPHGLVVTTTFEADPELAEALKRGKP